MTYTEPSHCSVSNAYAGKVVIVVVVAVVVVSSVVVVGWKEAIWSVNSATLA